VGDSFLDGASRLLGVRDVGRNDENVRRAAFPGGRGDALPRVLPPGHQRKARPFLSVLVSKLLHMMQT
jgi:hypothetical protein